MATIQNATYEIGVLKSGAQKDYPEFVRGRQRTVFGSTLIADGTTTWEDFFKANPLDLSPGIWHVYEVDGKGKLTWVIQGEASKTGNIQLGDAAMPDRDEKHGSKARIEALENELNEQKRENENLRRQLREDTSSVRQEYQARLDSAVAESKFFREENKELKAKYEKVFDDRLKDTVEITKLQYEIEKLTAEKDREVTTLKDNFSKEDKNMAAISQIISYYEDKGKAEKSSMLGDFFKDALNEVKPHIGGFIEATTEMLREKYGKKQAPADGQVYEG